MNKNIKHINKVFWLSSLIILSINCRQPVVPTEEDLAGYGWTLYETGEYEEAREWHGVGAIIAPQSSPSSATSQQTGGRPDFLDFWTPGSGGYGAQQSGVLDLWNLDLVSAG